MTPVSTSVAEANPQTCIHGCAPAGATQVELQLDVLASLVVIVHTAQRVGGLLVVDLQRAPCIASGIVTLQPNTATKNDSPAQQQAKDFTCGRLGNTHTRTLTTAAASVTCRRAPVRDALAAGAVAALGTVGADG